MAETLAVAHHASLVHRDITPSNIMIDSLGHAKLIDFGLAARFAVAPADTAIGTFAYSAPEQTGLLHRVVDGRADLYSLGVILFQLMTGRLPFPATDVAEQIRLHLVQPAPSLQTLRPDLPEAIGEIVAQLLAKDPDDRYQTGTELQADLLQRAVRGEPRPGPPGSSGPATQECDAAFFGRRSELGRLLARWHEAASGHGSLVVVTGQEGIGKSRLVRQLATMVGQSGGHPTWIAAAEDDAAPLAPVRSAIEHRMRAITGLPDAIRTSAIERLRRAAGDHGRLIRSLSPVLLDILASGIEFPSAELPGTDKEHFARIIANFLANLAASEGGAVLQAENLQWFDAASIDVLRHVMPLLRTTPLLVVATVRTATDADPGDWVSALPEPLRDQAGPGDNLVTHLPLGPLSGPDIEALVTEELGSTLIPGDLMARLRIRSAGNPLAAWEYTRALIDSGTIRPSWGRWLVDDSALCDLTLRKDVTDLIVRRLRHLDEDAQRLLTVAAASGNGFSPDLIAGVAHVALPAVLRVCEQATAIGVIEPIDGGRFGFVHDRIATTLLDLLGQADREALHRTIAEHLERQVPQSAELTYAIARQYLLGDPGQAPAAAVRALREAGFQALAQHAAADAFASLSQARKLADRFGIALDGAFHTNAGIAAAQSGRCDAGIRHFYQALDLETDRLTRAGLWVRLVDAHREMTEETLGLAAMRAGLAELGHPLPDSRLGLALTAGWSLCSGVLWGVLPRTAAVPPARVARWRVVADLLNAGAEAAATPDRIPLMTALNLCALPVSNRLGRGRPFVRARANLAILAKSAGLDRLAERLMASAEAAAPKGIPEVDAYLAWWRALIADALGEGTGDWLLACLERHGQLLNTGAALMTSTCVGMLAAARGYPQRALAAIDLAMRHAADREQVCRSGAGFVSAMTEAILGHPGAAAEQLSRACEAESLGRTGLTFEIHRLIAVTVLAVERAETGTELDDALDAFAALGIAPRRLWPYQRLFWVYQAFGRLAQLAAAPPEQRPRRMAQAKRAIRALGQAASGPVFRGYHRVARAGLCQLRGKHRAALRILADQNARPADPDAPLLDYEAARIAARALTGLGATSKAQRQAELALRLAEDHGWQARAKWIRVEFHLEPTWVSKPATARNGDPRTGEDDRMRALYEVGLAAATVLDPDQLARVALDEIVRIFGAERAFLFLVAEPTGALTPHLGRDSARRDIEDLSRYGASLVEQVYQSGTAIVVAGNEHSAALESRSAVVHGLRSVMVAPLRLKQRTVGVIYLDSTAAKGIFAADDVGLLTSITTSVALALETAKAAQLEVAIRAAERQRDTAEFLRGAMQRLASSLSTGEVAAALDAAVSEVLPDATARLVHQSEHGVLSLLVPSRVDAAGALAPSDEIRLEPSPTLAVLLGRSAPAGQTLDTDPWPLPDELLGASTHWLSIPLTARGVRRGILVIATTGRALDSAEVKVAAALASQTMVALDNAVLFRQVTFAATHDGLTGLLNRATFFEVGERRLAAWRSSGDQIAAAMIDIDHFKAINDTYGHTVGDQAIREVARQLTRTLRESDIIGRYGGEEFTVLFPDTTAEAALATAERLHAAILDHPVLSEAGALRMTVSIGLAVPPSRESTLSDLLSTADRALYVAKRQGRNRIVSMATA
ncbi:MAG: diguanylate cyclase [Micromonosporaceae bacterium]|nr:diguanylate cyclase [Micromonosporaceae bacterium]